MKIVILDPNVPSNVTMVRTKILSYGVMYTVTDKIRNVVSATMGEQVEYAVWNYMRWK
jgi:hypothetical protein